MTKIDEHLDKNKIEEEPTDTEMSVFIVSTFIKKIDLVDYNVKKSIHKTLGYEFDEEFDDDALLSNGDSSMSGFFDNVPGDEVKESQEEVPFEKSDKGVDSLQLDEIDKIIALKKRKLQDAEKNSFNTLEAINMSAFNVERDIQKLDEVLLRKEGYSTRDASRLSSLVASNITIDMGMKTNPDIISEKERRRKSPSISSKEVKNMISRFSDLSK